MSNVLIELYVDLQEQEHKENDATGRLLAMCEKRAGDVVQLSQLIPVAPNDRKTVKLRAELRKREYVKPKQKDTKISHFFQRKPSSPNKRAPYEPSPLEREWFELVNATRPLGCGVWHPDSVLAARISANVTARAEMTPSQMVYADGHGREHTVGIEPLVSSLRHPRLLTPGSHTRSALMDKRHLRIPSSDDLVRLGKRGARAILVDLGAGMFASGAPGSDNGASLGWIPQRFGEQGVHFERIFAWEARGYSARTLWRTIPPEMVPTLSYYNVPCEVAPNSSHNPCKPVAGPWCGRDEAGLRRRED